MHSVYLCSGQRFRHGLPDIYRTHHSCCIGGGGLYQHAFLPVAVGYRDISSGVGRGCCYWQSTYSDDWHCFIASMALTKHGSIVCIALGAHWLLCNCLLHWSGVVHSGLSACSSEELYKAVAKVGIGY